ncbi:hypothetical protein [Arhodomonas sp. KWT]|uniref:hypothetical protein n=1 Tax=Arhodomonas sp. KWT TaxID=2679915 RepID=UPI001969FD0A|nr:hypothetical protein [Arhodomonas sp. KWT]
MDHHAFADLPPRAPSPLCSTARDIQALCRGAGLPVKPAGVVHRDGDIAITEGLEDADPLALIPHQPVDNP